MPRPVLATPQSLPPASPRELFEELHHLEEVVRQASEALQQSPWTLPQALSSLSELARQQRRCWRRLMAEGVALPCAQLPAWLTSLASSAASVGAFSGPPDPPASAEVLIDRGRTSPPVAPADRESAAAESEPTPLSPGVQPADPAELDQPEEAVPEEPDAPLSGQLQLAAERASQAQIKGFAAIFRERKLAPREPHEVSPLVSRRESILREVLATLGPLPEVISTATARGLRERIERLTSDTWKQRWKELDGQLQVDLLTMLGATARALQEALGGLEYPHEAFLRLVDHSQRERPGYTHGLARKHEPLHGSWLQDARKAERGLRDWLGDDPRSPAPAAAAPAAAPAASLALVPSAPLALDAPSVPEDEALEVVSDEDAGSLLEADWRWWSQVRGKKAVLVGASPKETYRQRLLEVFGFSSLDWVDGHVRRISKLTSRVTHRGVDLILVVAKFISHKSSNKIIAACKQHGVPFAVLDRGHGVLAVRRAVERFVPC